MIVVFAREHDEDAKQIVRGWKDHGAMLMLPRDLSSAGWSCTSSEPSASTFVIAGQTYPATAIIGWLTRHPAIFPVDLPHIAESDRGFVASEMNAFLVYWLSTLCCPVLNRPTPRTLAGPGWDLEHWVHNASKLGIQTQNLERSIKVSVSNPTPNDPSDFDLVVIGERCFGEANSSLSEKVVALASLANVGFVGFGFKAAAGEHRLIRVEPFPKLHNPAIERAVLAYLSTAHPATTA
jgi:hypothetical protein